MGARKFEESELIKKMAEGFKEGYEYAVIVLAGLADVVQDKYNGKHKKILNTIIAGMATQINEIPVSDIEAVFAEKIAKMRQDEADAKLRFEILNEKKIIEGEPRIYQTLGGNDKIVVVGDLDE